MIITIDNVIPIVELELNFKLISPKNIYHLIFMIKILKSRIVLEVNYILELSKFILSLEYQKKIVQGYRENNLIRVTFFKRDQKNYSRILGKKFEHSRTVSN